MKKLIRRFLQYLFLPYIMDLMAPKVLIKHSNYKGDIYCERLCEEWLRYGKIALAVDFYGTISPWKNIDNNKDIQRVIRVLKEAQVVGAYIAIRTPCNPDHYKDISYYCKTIGLQIDSINNNPCHLPWGTHKEIYYNWLLDDRASLPEALDRFEYCLMRVRCEKKGMNEQNVEF